MLSTEIDTNEQLMSQAYQDQAESVVANLERYRKDNFTRQIGLEIEYAIVDYGQADCSEQQRDQVANRYPWLSPELGAAQIELHTDPMMVTAQGIEAMIWQFKHRESLMKAVALENNLQIIRSGTNPWLPPQQVVTTDKPKYRQVPDYYDQKRNRPNLDLNGNPAIRIDSLSVVSILNSFQVNLEATDWVDAIDLLNRSMMISPNLLALSANARYLSGQDSQIADMRMLVWSNAVDTRTPNQQLAQTETRVGLPNNYYSDVSHYLEEVGKYPFILFDPANALKIGIGMNWRDARLKFIQDSLIVEFRSLSTQPTVEEDIASTLLYLGRVFWSKQHQEPLLPMDLVKANYRQASLYGMNARLWAWEKDQLTQQPATELLQKDLKFAQVGLDQIGLGSSLTSYIEILEDRLQKGDPAFQLQRSVAKLKNSGLHTAEALRRLLTEP